MLHTAIEARFYFELSETRELAVSALLVNAKAAKLKPAAPRFPAARHADSGAPGAHHIRAIGALSVLADSLTEDAPPPSQNALRNQLGLRREARKSKLAVLVIDSADGMPTEN